MRIIHLDLRHKAASMSKPCGKLEQAGFAIARCEDVADAQFEALHSEFEAILLIVDAGLAGLQPIAILRGAGVRTPMLVLSREATREVRIEAIRKGADDILDYPCDHEELAVRLRALARRGRQHASSLLRCGDVALDLETHSVTVAGKSLDLTVKEFQLLEALLLRSGTTLSKGALLDQLYAGRDEPNGKIIDVLVCRIRKKIALHTSRIDCIQNVWGQGYRMAKNKRATNDRRFRQTKTASCPITRALYAPTATG